MKNRFNSLLAILVVSFLMTACAGNDKKRNADFLPLMKIELADEVKGDAELVAMIQSSEKAINEFSDNIEQLAIDGKDILIKKDEELSLMDGIKAGKLMIQFASNSSQMITSMEQFNTYVESQKAQNIINDEQLKALEQVGMAFKQRTDEINKKYEHYFDK